MTCEEMIHSETFIRCPAVVINLRKTNHGQLSLFLMGYSRSDVIVCVQGEEGVSPESQDTRVSPLAKHLHHSSSCTLYELPSSRTLLLTFWVETSPSSIVPHTTDSRNTLADMCTLFQYSPNMSHGMVALETFSQECYPVIGR